MAELLCLTDGELLHLRRTQILGNRLVDGRRGNQVLGRHMKVPIILHHPGVLDLRSALAVELGQFFCFKGLGDLKGTVSTEVEQDDTVPVLDGTHRLAILGNDEGRQILVNRLGLLAQLLNGLMGRIELPALTKYMGFPTLAHHIPVCIVTVHGNDHSSAAACNLCVKGCIVERSEELLKRIEILKGTHLTDITTGKQCMHTDRGNPFRFCLQDHCLEVVNVGVNIAIAEQADEMKGGFVRFRVVDELLPSLTGKHSLRLN